MCNAGVPDGDIELGLEAWDNSGNHYVYSQHYPNYHITKSYNCNPAPVAGFDAWLKAATRLSPSPCIIPPPVILTLASGRMVMAILDHRAMPTITILIMMEASIQ